MSELGAPASASRGACAAIALLSVLVILSWTGLRVHYVFGGNWTAIFYNGTVFTQPPDLPAGTYRIEGPGYDGQFYRLLAHDPFLTRGYYRYADSAQLRFRRLLIPLIAWLLAFGKQAWIDGGFVAVEMIFLGLGVYWCARILVRVGRSPAWGVLFVILPATMASFDRMLVDGPLAALFAGYLLYCDEERWGRVWVIAMLAALTRDTGLLLGVALALERLLRRDWRRAAWFASSIAPAVAWYAYVFARIPPDRPVAILATPVWGWIRRLLWLRPYPDAVTQLILRVTDVLAVLGLAISVFVAILWLSKSRLSPVTLCVALFAVLALVLGGREHMIDAFGFGRPISPLLLWVMLEAVSRRAWFALAPPSFVSLSVSLVFARPLLEVAQGLTGR